MSHMKNEIKFQFEANFGEFSLPIMYAVKRPVTDPIKVFWSVIPDGSPSTTILDRVLHSSYADYVETQIRDHYEYHLTDEEKTKGNL